MPSKSLLKYILYLILFIFLANFLANKFYWYYSIWWFDMPMHFAGGFWLGLVFLYFFGLFALKEVSFNSIFKILFLVCAVGIGWELFEVVFNNYIAQNSFNAMDTTSDIFFDLAGGTFAILYRFFILKRLDPPEKI